MSRLGIRSGTVSVVEHVSRSHLGDTDMLPWGACPPTTAQQQAKRARDATGETIGPTAVLALDLGTSTGWAVHSPDGSITNGSVSFRPGRFEGGGMRYLRFRHWLTDILQLVGNFEQIAFEEVRRHAGIDAAHVYGGLLATLTAWAEHNGIPYQGVPVGTWKKSLTGKGNSSKTDVVAAVKGLGYSPGTEDEADALGVLLWAMGPRR